jgi:hypothetical protein
MLLLFIEHSNYRMLLESSLTAGESDEKEVEAASPD